MDALVAELERRIGPLDGEPVALDGGITNRNFRARFGDGEYVLRVPGDKTDLLGIDRECEAQATALAHRLGIGPEVVAVVDGALVTRFIDGRPVVPAELRDRLPEVAAHLTALHGCGDTLPIAFDPLDIVQDYARIARERGVEPPTLYAAALERARVLVVDYDPVPCHNDLLAANFLEDGDGRLRILDWEYAGMGDRRFDLGNFAVNNDVSDEQMGEPLATHRFLSDFREAMWGVVQSSLSTLDFDFNAYADEHFARLAI